MKLTVLKCLDEITRVFLVVSITAMLFLNGCGSSKPATRSIEYKTVRVSRDDTIADKMVTLGEEGWILTTSYSGEFGNSRYFVFRRTK